MLTSRYSVFVNGRSRSVIMENMRSRIDRGDIKLERAEAIKVSIFKSTIGLCELIHMETKAMCDIAADRAFKLQP
jgi:hypothetical protein